MLFFIILKFFLNLFLSFCCYWKVRLVGVIINVCWINFLIFNFFNNKLVIIVLLVFGLFVSRNLIWGNLRK